MSGFFVAFIANAAACLLNVALYAADTSRSVALGCAVLNGLLALFFLAADSR